MARTRPCSDPTDRTGLQYQHLDYAPENRNDCSPRAWAKVTGEPYEAVYAELQSYQKAPINKNGTTFRATYLFAKKRGYVFDEGAWASKRLLKAAYLPKEPVVVHVRGHAVAVVNHVIHDSWDCRGKRSRKLAGIWIKKDKAA